ALPSMLLRLASQAAVLLLGSAACADAQLLRASDVDKLPSRAADERAAYGPDSLQFGELRLPVGAGPFPVAIVIHGGCWLARYATLQNTRALADALRDAGVATWNIEYRRADNPGGGWPGTFQDVAAAADYLRVLSKRQPLDLSRVIAIGHSAGGHLALWLAARRRLSPSSVLHVSNPVPLRGVVSLAGPGDLAEFLARDGQGCGGAVRQLMGGGPDEVPTRYAEGSPVLLLPIGVPHVLIAGALDRIVPPATAEAWVASAMRSGDLARRVTIDGAGHFEVIAPGSIAFPAVRTAVEELLKR
ncbi:MAG: alpha/beta hydrolase, partial [Gemmatimonadaceae bacterium]